MSEKAKAEICQWHEVAPNGGWTDTLYKGLLIRARNQVDILARKNRRGWQLARFDDPSKVQLAVAPVVDVELPEGLDLHIEEFLAKQEFFQATVGAALDQVMGE